MNRLTTNGMVREAMQGLTAVRRSLAVKRFGNGNVAAERRFLLETARMLGRGERALRPLCANARGRRGRNTKVLCATHAKLMQLMDEVARVLGMLRGR